MHSKNRIFYGKQKIFIGGNEVVERVPLKNVEKKNINLHGVDYISGLV